MIIATAGHVDHGKTSLVRALTGVDTDRLAEERRRGMTIDLGFAYVDADADADAAPPGPGAVDGAGPAATAEPLGFVDVPGHERFVRNMLAGVASVDLVLMVVAADDGPMPQTREHLAIVGLLGVPRCVVVLSKIDRVTDERRAQAEVEITTLLAGGPYAGAPVLAVATPSGTGLPALRRHLAAAAAALAARATTGHFRLVVDRSFALAGAGRIVTGVVLSGWLRVGDEVIVSPAGTLARVRGIHAQNRPADQARAGQRCALNLAGPGLKRAEPVRGDWVVAPAAHAPTDRLDVSVTVLASALRPLSQRSTLQLHLGAAVVNVRIVALGPVAETDRAPAAPEATGTPPPAPQPPRWRPASSPAAQPGLAVALLPGSTGLAQLVLDRPVAAQHGDRFILRDPAANRTLAGGRVIDPVGQARGRARPLRLQQLVALALPDAAAALAGLLATLPGGGVPLQPFAQARGLTDADTQALITTLALRQVPGPVGPLVLTEDGWQALRAELLGVLDHWHAAQPDSLGPDDATLRAALSGATGTRRAPSRAVQATAQTTALASVQTAALAALAAEGLLVRDGLRHRRAGHRVVLAEADRVLLDRVSAALRPAGLRPPIVGELAALLGLPLPALRDFLGRVTALGLLVRVAPNRWYLPEVVAELLTHVRALAAEADDGGLDAASYRDRTGIGRNLTVQVLEFLDREGLTRFDGTRHRPLV